MTLCQVKKVKREILKTAVMDPILFQESYVQGRYHTRERKLILFSTSNSSCRPRTQTTWVSFLDSEEASLKLLRSAKL